MSSKAWEYATGLILKIPEVLDKPKRRKIFGMMLNDFFTLNNSSDRAIWERDNSIEYEGKLV